MRLAALALVACTPALAQDVWVDPVNGSDANGGTSANDAFATITFALQTLGPNLDGVVDTVFLLPGVYGSTSGEILPLLVRRELELVGVEGAAQTELRGPGQGIGRVVEVVSTGTPFTAQTRLTGLTIRRAARGVSADIANLWLVECVVEECTYGVWQDLSCGLWISSVVMERCAVRDCVVGMRAGGCEFLVGSFSYVDSYVSDCATALSLEHAGDSVAAAFLTRTRVERCTIGIDVVNNSMHNQNMVWLRSSLIADGVQGIVSSGGGVRVEGSTITGHSSDGVSLDPAGYSAFGNIQGSIVWGNAADLDGGPWSADASNFGNATVIAGTGNVSVDPQFRDAPNGDYRIAFGTPCVDGGNFAEADLDGSERDVDGDLDLDSAPDMGALELLPLDGPPTVQPGAALELELHGPLDDYGWLRLSRTGLLATPVSTPYGDRWLRSQVETIAVVRTNGGTPAVVVIQVPANQALIGLTAGLQALVRSPLSPSGAAYSTPVLVEIVP